MLKFAKKIFGSKNDRVLKDLQPIVDQINSLEADIKKLSDSQLAGKTVEFRSQLEQGRTLDDILPEAFAVVREVAVRVMGMRHFDVQLIGGMVLHNGNIAEMKTGEGKTLAATLPVYLNALSGKGVHVVTVNDYLASRDADWMGQIYSFLGLTTGKIVHGMDDFERKDAYAADITYGTNNEFGFDFLRDNMKFEIEGMVQRELNFSIVDEVDSILIDEARTPLIISGPAEDSADKYAKINRCIPGLELDQHYQLDEKSRTVVLSEEGVSTMEKRLNVDNLYDAHNIETLHHVNQALRAHTLYKKDIDYICLDAEATVEGDRLETQALKNVFADAINNIALSAPKSMFGNLLGAQTALDLIATIFSMKHSTVLPTINYEVTDPYCDLDYTPNKAVEREINKALIIARGRGGINAVLAVEKE